MTQPRNPVHRFIDAVNAGDIKALEAACHPDFEMIVPQHPSRNFKGRDQEVRNMDHLMTTYPDGHLELLQMVESGDDIWIESTYKATGLDMAAVTIFRIDRGTDTIVSGRYYSDAVEPVGEGINEWINSLGDKR